MKKLTWFAGSLLLVLVLVTMMSVQAKADFVFAHNSETVSDYHIKTSVQNGAVAYQLYYKTAYLRDLGKNKTPTQLVNLEEPTRTHQGQSLWHNSTFLWIEAGAMTTATVGGWFLGRWLGGKFDGRKWLWMIPMSKTVGKWVTSLMGLFASYIGSQVAYTYYLLISGEREDVITNALATQEAAKEKKVLIDLKGSMTDLQAISALDERLRGI